MSLRTELSPACLLGGGRKAGSCQLWEAACCWERHVIAIVFTPWCHSHQEQGFLSSVLSCCLCHTAIALKSKCS